MNELFINLTTFGAFAPVIACLLIIIESMIPILPLFVFITINFLYFGTFFGFLISWLCTVIGCMISFTIFDKGIKNWFNKKIVKGKKVKKLMKLIDKLSLTKLVILMAIPFTPAFLLNIAGGLSDIKPTKYFVALLIGKTSLVYFWGIIGTSFVQSVENPIILLRIIGLISVAGLISYVVNKKLKIV